MLAQNSEKKSQNSKMLAQNSEKKSRNCSVNSLLRGKKSELRRKTSKFQDVKLRQKNQIIYIFIPYENKLP